MHGNGESIRWKLVSSGNMETTVRSNFRRPDRSYSLLSKFYIKLPHILLSHLDHSPIPTWNEIHGHTTPPTSGARVSGGGGGRAPPQHDVGALPFSLLGQNLVGHGAIEHTMRDATISAGGPRQEQILVVSGAEEEVGRIRPGSGGTTPHRRHPRHQFMALFFCFCFSFVLHLICFASHSMKLRKTCWYYDKSRMNHCCSSVSPMDFRWNISFLVRIMIIDFLYDSWTQILVIDFCVSSCWIIHETNWKNLECVCWMLYGSCLRGNAPNLVQVWRLH
jgi:hypothetical protein